MAKDTGENSFARVVRDVYRASLNTSSDKEIGERVGRTGGRVSQFLNDPMGIESRAIDTLLDPIPNIEGRRKILAAWIRERFPEEAANGQDPGALTASQPKKVSPRASARGWKKLPYSVIMLRVAAQDHFKFNELGRAMKYHSEAVTLDSSNVRKGYSYSSLLIDWLLMLRKVKGLPIPYIESALTYVHQTISEEVVDDAGSEKARFLEFVGVIRTLFRVDLIEAGYLVVPSDQELDRIGGNLEDILERNLQDQMTHYAGVALVRLHLIRGAPQSAIQVLSKTLIVKIPLIETVPLLHAKALAQSGDFERATSILYDAIANAFSKGEYLNCYEAERELAIVLLAQSPILPLKL